MYEPLGDFDKYREGDEHPKAKRHPDAQPDLQGGR